MWSLPVGFLLFAGFIFASTPLSAWPNYINLHSIMIVVGGTIGLFAFTSPVNVLKNLARALRELGHPDPDVAEHVKEFEQLVETRRLEKKSKNALINYAVELFENGTSPEMFHVLISQKREKLESNMTDAVQAIRNMAKYPPALGMTGTVMGLVTLFTNLSESNKDKLGPALGLAMTATFFGLLVANGVLMPLADRLQVSHIRRKEYYSAIYEVLLLINRREPDMLIMSEVKERVAA